MLARSLATAHGEAVRAGLALSLNGTPTHIAQEALLCVSGKVAPSLQRFSHAPEAAEPVSISVYCGIGEPSPPRAGWYVYCNGRLILDADKTTITGWGERDEAKMPRFHNQYSRFRGFAYFKCKDPDRLPWNTTKTGLDQDSRVWRATRPKMLDAMREVLNYLNDVKKRADEHGEDPEELIRRTLGPTPQRSAPYEISRRRGFVGWLPPEKEGPVLGHVQYRRPARLIEAVRDALGARSNVQAGEMTFDLFCEREGIE
jgi:hypothetical protein